KGYSPTPRTRFSRRLPSRRPSQDRHQNSLSSPAHCWQSTRPVRNPTPRRESLACSRPGSLPRNAAARLLTRPPRSHSTLHSPRTGNPLDTASFNLTLEQVFLVYRREEVFGWGQLSNFHQGRIERAPSAQVRKTLRGKRVY